MTPNPVASMSLPYGLPDFASITAEDWHAALIDGMAEQLVELDAIATDPNPPAAENQLWASATVVRVAKRLHWNVPPAFTQLVHDAAAERDQVKSAALWRNYQDQMRDFAHLFVLIQPVYQVAVRKNVAGLKITAAGWMAEFDAAKPV